MLQPRSRAECAALILSLVVSSCSVVQGVANAPGQIVGAVSGAPKDVPSIDLDQVSSEAMRFADRIAAQVDAGAYVFCTKNTSAEGAEWSLSWKLNAAERAFQLAAQTRPVAALADLVALCAYEKKAHEAHWSAIFGEADASMIEAWGVLQEQGLDAADRCLPAAQCQEMRSVLTKWSSGASNAEELLRTGPPRFEELASKSAVDGQKGSLLGAIGLDPLDSLEPAARELARTRELGERAVFLAQRMPRTLEWRTELLALHAARQPALTSLLQNVERTTTAAQDAVATADALPKKLREEGDALITRVSSELAVQREGLVKDFERISAPTKELLAQLQQTLDAATRLSQSLDTTTKTVDTFIANVTAPSPEPATPKEPEPPGKPFDPNEYTQLATQVTGTLHELNTAVTGLDRSLPALQRTVEESAARVDSSVKRAWGLAIWLVLIAVVAVSAAVVLVRSISSRRQPA